MSTIEHPGTARATAMGAGEVRAHATDTMHTPERAWRRMRETKPSVKTSELWLTLAGIAALIVTYVAAADTSFDLFRLCLLATVAGAAYVISRGFAKSGGHDEKIDRMDRR